MMNASIRNLAFHFKPYDSRYHEHLDAIMLFTNKPYSFPIRILIIDQHVSLNTQSLPDSDFSSLSIHVQLIFMV